jgi:hypothetical protein
MNSKRSDFGFDLTVWSSDFMKEVFSDISETSFT